jgi:phosphoribosylamine--glycine ligase
MAAHGYPAAPRSGDVIGGVSAPAAFASAAQAAEPADLQVFHAGTELVDGQLLTRGGRVLCVTALGDSARLAQQRALEAVRRIHFDGAHWRNDIGHRAIKH